MSNDDWLGANNAWAQEMRRREVCPHLRTSTNRTPKTTVTWCLDCGKVLEKVARESK